MNADTLPTKAPSSPADSRISDGMLSFNRFEFDPQRGVLRSGGIEIPMRPKNFGLLQHFIANPGRLISKDELMRTLWPDVVVTEDSLVQCIGELRAALDDREQRLIKTVPRRGYMLDASVQAASPAAKTGSDRPVADTPAKAMPSPRRYFKVAVLVLAIALPVIGGITWWWPPLVRHIDSAIAAQRAIAILPFADLSERPSPAFPDAVVEDLIVAVAQLPDTLVFASGSTAGLGGPNVDVRAAGRLLGATHVLTGSVQRNGDAVLIRAKLQRADNGALLWSERFEYTGNSHWTWQRDITQRIANTLDVRLREVHIPPNNGAGERHDVIEMTQQGTYLVRRAKDRDDLLRARALFEAALAQDPDSVAALSGWGFSHLAEDAESLDH